MAKTKLAVIQDDITAVKHALANNLPFEGLEGEPLNNVLQTLLAQRTEEAAATTATAPRSSSSASPSSASPTLSAGGSSNIGTITRTPVKGARPKVVAKKATGKTKTKTTPSATKAEPVAFSKRPQTTPPKTSPSSAPKTPAPEQRRQASSGKSAKKPRTSGAQDRLRHLRQSIKAGDTLSVLMDVNIRGCWEKEWVAGEVIREMNRSGIFQIAFDQDRYGNKSAVKQEPSGQVPSGTEDTDRWIHEQRLQIDHPNFFCGQGDTPPVGLDNCRPRGAWFLHQKSVVQREQDQQQQPVLQPVAPPVAPLVASSRTPYSLSNGGGGHCSGSSGTSPALPQSHVAWGPASFGDASGNLGGNLSNGSGGHSSGSSATSPAPPQSQVAWGPAPLGDDSGNLGGSGIAVAAAAQTSTGAADSAQQELDASDLLDA